MGSFITLYQILLLDQALIVFVGQAATGLLEKEMPQEMEAPEAFCTPDHVHHLVH